MLKPIYSQLRLACVLSISLLLSGCFEERVLVQVKKDGSGFVQHKSYNSVGDLMSSMLGGLGDEASNSGESEYNDDYFAARAEQMGTGVTVDNWRLASNSAGFKGYEASYKFADINTLTVETAPFKDDGKSEQAPVDGSALETQHYYTMSDGKLTIHTPEPETEENQQEMANQVDDAAAQQMLALMGSMFRGARVSIEVEALDAIKSTNAKHRNDNRITVMDVRVDQLISDPKLFTELQRFNGLNREEAQALADRIDGIDVDTQAEITIQF